MILKKLFIDIQEIYHLFVANKKYIKNIIIV